MIFGNGMGTQTLQTSVKGGVFLQPSRGLNDEVSAKPFPSPLLDTVAAATGFSLSPSKRLTVCERLSAIASVTPFGLWGL